MKKVILTFVVLCAAIFANAQTEKGKWVLGAEVPFGVSVGAPSAGIEFGDGYTQYAISLKAGTFIADDLLVHASLGFQGYKPKDVDATTAFNFGLGAKYYIMSKIPVGISYELSKVKDVDLAHGMNLNAGYAFFIKECVSIEPGVYYTLPFESGAKGAFGIKAGINFIF